VWTVAGLTHEIAVDDVKVSVEAAHEQPHELADGKWIKE